MVDVGLNKIKVECDFKFTSSRVIIRKYRLLSLLNWKKMFFGKKVMTLYLAV